MVNLFSKSFSFTFLYLLNFFNMVFADQVVYEGVGIAAQPSFAYVLLDGSQRCQADYQTAIVPMAMYVEGNKIESVRRGTREFSNKAYLGFYKNHFSHLQDFETAFGNGAHNLFRITKFKALPDCPLKKAGWATLKDNRSTFLVVVGECTLQETLDQLDAPLVFTGMLKDSTDVSGQIEFVIDPIGKRIQGTCLIHGSPYAFNQSYDSLVQGMSVPFDGAEEGSTLHLHFYGDDNIEVGGILHIEQVVKTVPPQIALFGAWQ